MKLVLPTAVVGLLAAAAFGQGANLTMVGQSSLAGHVSYPQISPSGTVSFMRGSSASTGPFNAIMQGSFGSPGVPIYESGDPVPNLTDTVLAQIIRQHVVQGSVWFSANYHPVGQPGSAIQGWFLNGAWNFDGASLSLAISNSTIWSGSGGILHGCPDPGNCYAVTDGLTLVPGTSPQQTFNQTAALGLNEVGLYVFSTYDILAAPNSEDSGLFLFTGTSPYYEELVREGDLLPGASSRPVVEAALGPASINVDGAVAFFAGLDNGSVVPTQGLWMKHPLAATALVAVVRDNSLSIAGTSLPGISSGELGIFVGGDPAIDEESDVTFGGRADNGITSAYGIWKWISSTGDIEKIYIEGDNAPGTCGQFVGSPSLFWVNEGGAVAFYAGTSTGDLGLWIKPVGSAMGLVAKVGDWVLDLNGVRRRISAFNLDQFQYSSPGSGTPRFFDENGRVVMRTSYSCDSDSGVAVVVGQIGTTEFCECICSADYNGDGDFGTDGDIEAFFACMAGNCCCTCDDADINCDGDIGTDADIEAFFRVLGSGPCVP